MRPRNQNDRIDCAGGPWVRRWQGRSPITLEYGEIHVWQMEFSSVGRPELCWQVMNDQERARASSFRFATDQERFCKSRLLLRQVLGRYLGLEPSMVEMLPDRDGKPILGNAGTNHDIHFNLSHCRSEALLAVTVGQPVGIDVEDARSVDTVDAAKLARDNFTEREAQFIGRLEGQDQARAFLLCWTRKEALLKAVGLGLLARLNSFEVPLDRATGWWQIAWLADDGSKESIFEMVDLTRAEIFSAVAAREIMSPVLTFDFKDLSAASRVHIRRDTSSHPS